MEKKKVCATCGTVEIRSEGLYCPNLEEAVSAEDSCPEDGENGWIPRKKEGKLARCDDCGLRGDCEDQGNPDCGLWEPEAWISENESDGELEKSLSGQSVIQQAPSSQNTIDFNLYLIPEFGHELGVSLTEVYNYFGKGGEGDASVTIKLTGFKDNVKAQIITDLPHKIKTDLGVVETVRENGCFRIVLPAQRDIFEQEQK